MKLLLILISFMVLANALTYVPAAQRLRRDVSGLVSAPSNEYLSPPAEADISDEALTENPLQETEIQDSAILGENGYEYKTVNKLRFRKRRDVSHLKQHYLPPTNEYLPPVNAKESAPELSKVFLPPVDVKEAEEPQPSNEYLPPVNAKEAEISTEPPASSNEYLPPVNVKESEIVTEISQPSNEYLPPAKLEEVIETETEPSTKAIEDVVPETEAPEISTSAPLQEEESSTDMPETETEIPQQYSAILLDDGYHYRKPVDIPNFFLQPNSAEFLPPLDGDSVEVEGPSDGESAVLAEDGYHYRAIKRRF